jgi:hypothetical protein
MSLRTLLVGLSLLLATPSESAAKAVLITHGDTISHVGGIQTKGAPLAAPIDVDGVGYKYSYFGIFWLDLWRYDGQYCIYRGDHYQAISEAEAAMLLGISEADLHTPFFYRFPPGLIVLVALAVPGIGIALVRKARKKQLVNLAGEPHYQRALEIFSETTRANEEAKKTAAEKNEPAPTTEANPWESAIAYLVASGIERSEAEEKFGKVLALVLEQMATEAQQQQ